MIPLDILISVSWLLMLLQHVIACAPRLVSEASFCADVRPGSVARRFSWCAQIPKPRSKPIQILNLDLTWTCIVEIVLADFRVVEGQNIDPN